MQDVVNAAITYLNQPFWTANFIGNARNAAKRKSCNSKKGRACVLGTSLLYLLSYDDRFIFSNDDGMFDLGHEALIRRDICPAVAFFYYILCFH
jgi:hypothetical protein